MVRYKQILLYFKRILIVSSRSSKSHSMLLKEFLSSVVVHSDSATEVSPISRHLKYSPLVLFRALNTSLNRNKNDFTTPRQPLGQFNKNFKIKFPFENLGKCRTNSQSHTYSFTTKKGSSKDMSLNG